MPEENKLPTTPVQGNPDQDNQPVRTINPVTLAALGTNLNSLFSRYKSDRQQVEQKWMRNLRQYMGLYDPDIERALSAKRSKAYPRITRVKCVSVLARIMNLMFPGNERNWAIKASPSADMSPEDVQEAIDRLRAKNEEAGIQSNMPDDEIQEAVNSLADERAKKLATVIDDQLQEIGGDQTLDNIALNRKVVASGIMYGLGVLRGPFVRSQKTTKWQIDPQTQQPTPIEGISYKPMFEFLPVWDYYPDMTSKNLMADADGYFTRVIMTRSQLRALGERDDFFRAQIKKAIDLYTNGNYKPQSFETELRAMGTKQNVNEQKTDGNGRYEVIVWHGPVSGQQLREVGADVADDKLSDDIMAEVWMVEGSVIKAEINAWRAMGSDVRTAHIFMFDEDDTSPIGNGLPNVMRDSQMAIAAATRMLLDNAGVVAGPNLEVNTDLLRADQDISGTHAYKTWYREGTGVDAQFPAVRNVQIDSHMDELLKVIELFMSFADAETFVGPATGGDMSQGPSEPMRTAAGASMLRGDAALPFKDIIRNFDTFTQSVILSIVKFNRKFNPDKAPAGDFNVIARGATSLIAKEVRGMQLDALAATLTDEERIYVDERKMVEGRFAVRDMQDMMLPEDEVRRAKAGNAQEMQRIQEQEEKTSEANIRKVLSDAFKNIAQGQKNIVGADATAVQSVLKLLEAGLTEELKNEELIEKQAERTGEDPEVLRGRNRNPLGGAGL